MFRFFTFLVVLIIPLALSAGSFSVSDGEYADSQVTEIVNSQMERIAADLKEDEPIIGLLGNQNKLANACNNANSSTILTATFYSGIDASVGAAGFGFGLAAVDPRSGIEKEIERDAKEGEDTKFGASVGGVGSYITMNGDRLDFIPVKSLSLEAKVSYFQSSDVSDIEYNSFMIGFGSRYRFGTVPVQFPGFSMGSLSIGTGIYYSHTGASYKYENVKQKSGLDTIGSGENESTIQTFTNTDLDFNVNSHSITVPCELVTSFKLLYTVKLYAGTGFDMVFGVTTIDVSSKSDIDVKQDGVTLEPIRSPKLNLKDSTTTAYPDIVRYKMIGGVGVELGPAIVEAPVTYFPADKGVAVSLVVGASF